MSADSHNHAATAPAEALDPVCGMTITPADAVGHVDHKGEPYYFCSESCLEQFRSDPDRFLAGGQPLPAATASAKDLEYTCPMHPEIVQSEPGACPICGMALEPRTVTLETKNPELEDMTRRFRASLGGGRLGLRGMLSLESWTVAGCGYPDRFATGEVCDGENIHDRQHPHDLLMELAADYDRPLRGSVRWQAYGGVAGEPALGPVTYPHRLSATPNPIAPISHHWLDATHITFGVVTGGVYGARWKAEGSVFNGREPDEDRTNVDLGALDSLSARVWLLPTSSVALQISAGRLTEAEEAHADGPRVDVNRITASGTYHRLLSADGVWASTVALGEELGGGRIDEFVVSRDEPHSARTRHMVRPIRSGPQACARSEHSGYR